MSRHPVLLTSEADLRYARGLTPTTVKSAAYTAAVGDLVLCDTTTAAFTVTLPLNPPDKCRIAVKHVLQGGVNVVTIACPAGQALNRSGGPTSATLPLINQSVQFQWNAADGAWIVSANDLPLSGLDARFGNHAAKHAPGGSDDIYGGFGHEGSGLFEPFPVWATAGNFGMTSGVVYLNYRRANIALLIANLGYICRGTASSGLTLARLGLYSVDGAGALTLVARTASDTTLGNAANNQFSRPLDVAGGYPATYQMVRGQLYAVAHIFVGTTPGNAAAGGLGQTGNVGPAFKGRDPLNMMVAGQADLPAAIAANAPAGYGSWTYNFAST